MLDFSQYFNFQGNCECVKLVHTLLKNYNIVKNKHSNIFMLSFLKLVIAQFTLILKLKTQYLFLLNIKFGIVYLRL